MPPPPPPPPPPTTKYSIADTHGMVKRQLDAVFRNVTVSKPPADNTV
jgi:hypothetical protein